MERNYIKFLIVDDSLSLRKKLADIVQDLIYVQIDEAENGRLAKEAVLNAIKKREPYYVIFLDINMPEMTGMEFLTWLKDEPKVKTLPKVVMITTESGAENVIEAIDMGAIDFISKPFKKERVQLILRKLKAEIVFKQQAED